MLFGSEIAKSQTQQTEEKLPVSYCLTAEELLKKNVSVGNYTTIQGIEFAAIRQIDGDSLHSEPGFYVKKGNTYCWVVTLYKTLGDLEPWKATAYTAKPRYERDNCNMREDLIALEFIDRKGEIEWTEIFDPISMTTIGCSIR